MLKHNNRLLLAGLSFIQLLTLKKVAMVLGLSLIINLIPNAKASERYPTEREIQQLRSNFSRRIQEVLSGNFRHYIDDRRTALERQQHQNLVNNWSQINPSIAPFLGVWSGYEQTLIIYPSTIPNQACLIEQSEMGYESFATATFQNGNIRTTDRRFIIHSGNYLGIAGVYNGQPFVGGDMPLNNPRPIPTSLDSEEFLSLLSRHFEQRRISENRRMQIIREFDRAGCTALAPQSPESDLSPSIPIASDPEVETILRLVREPIMDIWPGINSYFVDGVAIVNNYSIVQYGVGQNGGSVVLQKINGQWSVLTNSFAMNPDDLIRIGVPRNTASTLFNQMENFIRQRTEQRELRQFQQVWSEVNPSIAQFLGYWQAGITNGSSSVSIYPSIVPDQVCVVRFSGFNSRMEIGQISRNRIITPTTSFTYDVDNFPYPDGILVSDAYEYIAFPQPLNTWHFSESTIRQLNSAQCTLLP